MDSHLSTRNMVNAVNEEFWKMVKGSVDEQAVVFSGMLCNNVCVLCVLSVFPKLLMYALTHIC